VGVIDIHHVMMAFRGVISHASSIEVFATRIKMESSNQTFFWKPIKGSRRFWATNINWSTHFLRY